MKHIGTVLFIAACLVIGFILGQVILNYVHKVPTVSHEERGFDGPLPQVRGIHTALTLDSPVDQWKAHAKHQTELGATWVILEAKAAAFPAGTANLLAIAAGTHEAKLKLAVIIDIPTRPGNAQTVSPPSLEQTTPAIAAGNEAGVDALMLDPSLGDDEPADEEWAGFIDDAKRVSKVPLGYVATFSAAPRVTWWTHVDYVGVRGPIELTDRPDGATADATLHFLRFSWRARQDLILSLNLRDHVPVMFLDISFPDQPQGTRQELCYQAAVENSRGAAVLMPEKSDKPWLAGEFFRLSESPAAGAVIEKTLQSAWK